MKYISFAELLQQPQGTIFQEFNTYGLGEPRILGETMDNDFVYAQLLTCESPVEVFGAGLPSVLEKWAIKKDDYAVYYPSGFGRDALYNENNRHFVVWEERDRLRFAKCLLYPLTALKEMNDDPHALIAVPWDDRCIKP